jgi:hypothetical protein
MVSTFFAGLYLLAVIGGAHDSKQAEPVRFESHPRRIEKGRDPQIAVRASGDIFLLRVNDQNLWLQTSSDGGDSFDDGVRVNDVGEVSSHAESTPQMLVRTMHEFYCVWEATDGHGHSGLRFARSMDWGKSFSKSVEVEPSDKSGQGFFTMAVAPDGAVFVAWLGRDRGQAGSGSSALYLARSANHGQSFEKSAKIATRVCPCCRPSIAFDSSKHVYITWRGVLDGDVRDMLLAASNDNGVSFAPAARVASDGWQINGCPHSGASLAVENGRLFISWHTVKNGQPELYLAWSDDRGKHFSKPALAAGNILDANHSRLISLEGRLGLLFQGREPDATGGWGKLDVFFREIEISGRLLPLRRLGHSAGSAMYPTAVYENPNHVYVVWTERTDEGSSIVLSRGRLSAGNAAQLPVHDDNISSASNTSKAQ